MNNMDMSSFKMIKKIKNTKKFTREIFSATKIIGFHSFLNFIFQEIGQEI